MISVGLHNEVQQGSSGCLSVVDAAVAQGQNVNVNVKKASFCLYQLKAVHLGSRARKSVEAAVLINESVALIITGLCSY